MVGCVQDKACYRWHKCSGIHSRKGARQEVASGTSDPEVAKSKPDDSQEEDTGARKGQLCKGPGAGDCLACSSVSTAGENSGEKSR